MGSPLLAHKKTGHQGRFLIAEANQKIIRDLRDEPASPLPRFPSHE